jgi:hypothetical protein
MAITLSIVGQPASIVAAYNPIEYKIRVSPSGSAQSVSIAIYHADTVALIAQWSQQIDFGSADTFTFRLEQVLQDKLAYNLHQPNVFGVLEVPDASVKVFCVFLNDDQTASQITTPIIAINGGLQPDVEPTLSPYVMDGNGTKRFLTSSMPEKEVQLDEFETLSIAADTTTSLVANIKSYFPGNSTPTITNIALPSAIVGKKRFDIAVGPRNLNLAQALTITEAHSHYDVTITSSGTENFFLDMDSGTMEASINGFLAGPGFTTGLQSNALAHTGTKSLKVNFSDGPSSGSFNNGWKSSSVLPLAQNTTYTFSCWVYCTGTKSTSYPPIMRIGVEGLTDASVTHTSTWDAGALNQWLLMTTEVVTGLDTAARLVVDKAGAWSGLTVYFDDVNVSGIRAFSETKRYLLKKTCSHGTRVHFLNRLGGMDSYTFAGAEKRNIKTESSSFEKLKPTWFNATNRGRQVLQKQGTMRLSCSSDALRPDEMVWLHELLTSPAVYVQQGDKLLPVLLRDGEFEILDPAKNILRLRVELEYANDMILQRN